MGVEDREEIYVSKAKEVLSKFYPEVHPYVNKLDYRVCNSCEGCWGCNACCGDDALSTLRYKLISNSHSCLGCGGCNSCGPS